jgi:DNA-binding NarL/FixJ family response regulator
VAQQIAIYSAGDRLTEREIAILKAISEGRANKEIARRLHVSVDTVKADMKRIFSKLDVTDRTRAVIVAIQRGSLHI